MAVSGSTAVKPRGASSIWIFPDGKVARRHFEAGQKFDIALLPTDGALADAVTR
jgi:hypothetical protein